MNDSLLFETHPPEGKTGGEVPKTHEAKETYQAQRAHEPYRTGVAVRASRPVSEAI